MPTDPQSRDIIENVGAELKANPPGILAKTRTNKGPAAEKAQRVAILLNKSRKAGAKIPRGKSI